MGFSWFAQRWVSHGGNTPFLWVLDGFGFRLIHIVLVHQILQTLVANFCQQRADLISRSSVFPAASKTSQSLEILGMAWWSRDGPHQWRQIGKVRRDTMGWDGATRTLRFRGMSFSNISIWRHHSKPASHKKSRQNPIKTLHRGLSPETGDTANVRCYQGKKWTLKRIQPYKACKLQAPLQCFEMVSLLGLWGNGRTVHWPSRTTPCLKLSGYPKCHQESTPTTASLYVSGGRLTSLFKMAFGGVIAQKV